MTVGGGKSATMALGAATWYQRYAKADSISSGNTSFYSGSITISKVTATSAEITVEAGNNASGKPAASDRHYIKGTFPVTFCK